MVKVALQAFINASLLDNAWSPDLFDFTAKYAYVPMFLYGKEKVGYAEDLSLLGPPRIGVGTTMGPPYLMYMYQDYPVVLPGLINPQNARIYGHLFMVTPDQLVELDARHQQGAYFDRKPVWVTYCRAEDRSRSDKETFNSRAWMYIGKRSSWASRLEKHEIKLLPKVTPKGGQEFYNFGLDTASLNSMAKHVL